MTYNKSVPIDSTHFFTSESVSEGHPDKLADHISDAILDACLEQDPESRVACETFVTSALVLVGGEITTRANISVKDIATEVARKVGYTNSDYGLNCDSMAVLNVVHSQSPDIAQGVDTGGAGDQGLMFGYACTETEALMPAPIYYSHKILKRAAEYRKNGKIPWLLPDSKCQLTLRYENCKVVSVQAVVLSHQHQPEISQKEISTVLKEQIINPILSEAELLDDDTQYFINPTGRFVIGGPHGDAGLTGRKVIVDTYGGMGRHGGGAFSGKDPSKVDRSASYMARYIAKNIVAAGIANKVEVQLAYAIGVAEPIQVAVNSFGSAAVPDSHIEQAIRRNFDLTPAGIIEALKLKQVKYTQTTNYGHFGRENLPWEACDKIQDIQKALAKF